MDLKKLSPAAWQAVMYETWFDLSDVELAQAIGNEVDKRLELGGPETAVGHTLAIWAALGIKIRRPIDHMCLKCGARSKIK